MSNLQLDGCNLVYECVNCQNCYQTFYGTDCESCHNVWFSKNLSGCSDCFGCVNLRKKQYHIYNKEYEKSEYEKELAKLNPRSSKNHKLFIEELQKITLSLPTKFIHGRQNHNISGDYISHSENIYNSYFVTEAQNCRYCMWAQVKPTKDCWDYTEYGDNAERVYETLLAGNGISDVKFGTNIFKSCHEIEYTIRGYVSNNCFGCANIRNASYCILNKKYSPEEYTKIVPKIKEHMNSMPYKDQERITYSYGEFFPEALSPFAYNETTAYEYFPLSEKEAASIGYSWKEAESKNHSPTIKSEDVPETIETVGDTILNQIIECAHKGNCNEKCTTAFKIIPSELAFYRREGLPIPKTCPNCRYYNRFKKRNPLKLYPRSCMCEKPNHTHQGKCLTTFETTYSPERPEIIYCESCYQAEVV